MSAETPAIIENGQDAVQKVGIMRMSCHIFREWKIATEDYQILEVKMGLYMSLEEKEITHFTKLL